MLLMSFKEQNIILRTYCEAQSWVEHEAVMYTEVAYTNYVHPKDLKVRFRSNVLSFLGLL